MSVVVTAENLGKSYLLSHQVKHTSLRDLLTDRARSLGRRLQGKLGSEGACAGKETFWALQDVGFEVKQGDRVGIIGRNGAGKSTLLKILSRITEPSTGSVRIRGRVASLLEVGTGFHGDLSGRENIFLNGTILGMARSEIRKKFDEIVAFAEIEKFLDTPVKRYSSGMYVRLAFAVAAHLEPDILVVDEVLAVGDAQFQKKCLGKMEEVSAREGRTVLFVSHNMAVVENLCPRALLLTNGRLVCDDRSDLVIERYQRLVADVNRTSLGAREDRIGEGGIRIFDLAVTDASGEPVQAVHSGQRVNFVLNFTAEREFRNVEFSVSFRTMLRSNLFYCETKQSSSSFDIPKGAGAVACAIDSFPLAPGRYLMNVMAFRGGTIFDWVVDAGIIDVEYGDFFGNGATTLPGHSPFLVSSQWGSRV